jgi:hypothetical protein
LGGGNAGKGGRNPADYNGGLEMQIIEKSRLSTIDNETLERLLKDFDLKKAVIPEEYYVMIGQDRYNLFAIERENGVEVIITKNQRLTDYVVVKL